MSDALSQRRGIDKGRARRAFARAADRYDAAAVLQREVGSRLVERLDYVRLDPQRVLDAGTGTGEALPALLQRYPRAELLALDFALPMLTHARQRRRPRWGWWRRAKCVCGDIEALPLADASIGLLFSNLALQWIVDPAATFSEVRRVLAPGGLLTFTTFGPDTLKELRAAWAEVDGAGHVHEFVDMHDLGDAMLAAGLSDPVLDAEMLTLTYADLGGLMRDLKSIGAGNAAGDRPRALSGRRRFDRLRTAYERYRADGRLPATFEVVYGHAWGPEAHRQQIGHGGEVRVPVERLRR